MAIYREIGGSLGSYIRRSSPTTQQIQALLGDLLPGDELLLPLRDVVARPSFRSLYELAGSGKGSIQRDALLQELARSYLHQIVDQVGQVLNGMLDLPAGKTTRWNDAVNVSHTEPSVESEVFREGEGTTRDKGAEQETNRHRSPNWGWGSFADEELPGCKSKNKKQRPDKMDEPIFANSEAEDSLPKTTARLATSANTELSKKERINLGLAVGTLGIILITGSSLISTSHTQQRSVLSQSIKPAHCDQDSSWRAYITQMANNLEEYISVSGKVENPVQQGTWQSALTFLTSKDTRPISYRADQEEFIQTAEEFKIECE